MAHPKSRISKQRKRKRRTHYKAPMPTFGICKTTGEAHEMHRAYYHEGDLYYRGKLLIKNTEDVDLEAAE